MKGVGGNEPDVFPFVPGRVPLSVPACDEGWPPVPLTPHSRSLGDPTDKTTASGYTVSRDFGTVPARGLWTSTWQWLLIGRLGPFVAYIFGRGNRNQSRVNAVGFNTGHRMAIEWQLFAFRRAAALPVRYTAVGDFVVVLLTSSERQIHAEIKETVFCYVFN